MGSLVTVKCQFEKDFLAWLQGKSDIQESTYEEDCKRQKKNNLKEGITTDSKEGEKWSDSCRYPDELPNASNKDE